MPFTSILTDSTAQFTSLNYEGHELVSVIPMHIQAEDEWLRDTRDPRVCLRLAGMQNGVLPRLHPPTVEEFTQAFTESGQKSNMVLAILTSAQLCNSVLNAQKAAEIVKGPANFQIIDSQSIGPGLGLLVQSAAQAALKENNGAHLKRLVLGIIPHIYTAFCFQSMRSLANAGYIDPAQAIIGDMLNVIPFYMMDAGRLVPVQKARSPRQIVDLLHEFASEFDRLDHIAILQGFPPYDQEARNLRDRLGQNFPEIAISEHMLSASLLTLFGPRSLGLVAYEHIEVDAL